MIDAHCHFDITPNPEQYIHHNEERNIVTIGMTNLPSSFCIGRPQINRFKHIRLALGLHPLLAREHTAKEKSLFLSQLEQTTYDRNFSELIRVIKNV